MKIKPIETVYNGYRFRSRLEARWAVFFDTLDIEYEYEKEGYDLGEAGWYLPDFWLPQVKMWAEVKGTIFTDKEKYKAEMLVLHTDSPCLMLSGTPENKAYYAIVWDDNNDDSPGFEREGYILTDFWLSENRFWYLDGSEGNDDGFNDYDSYEPFGSTKEAVIAARSARFERV
jgi:hypothetical protein